MNHIKILNREITKEELQQVYAGFDQHTLDNNVQIQSSTRHSFVALSKDKFIGCSSGLAYKNGEVYSGWFYLTDLFVEKEFRNSGLGAKLLLNLEAEIKELGVQHSWTWTAGYEAPAFYQKLGYEIFTEMENWYSDGSSRVGLRKELSSIANTL